MHISTVKSGKYQYVRLYESYRDDSGKKKLRTIKQLGRLDVLLAENPNALEELKQKYCAPEWEQRAQAYGAVRMARAKEALKPFPETQKDRTSGGALLMYGQYALRQLWAEVGFDRQIAYLQKTKSKAQFDLNQAISHLVFTKIISPSSILSAFQKQDEYLGAPWRGVSLDACYDTLDFVNQHKSALFRTINRHLDSKFGKERTSLLFYDVTNTYFETPLTDAETGYERKDFPEILQEAVKACIEEGTLTNDVLDEDGNVIAENLPEGFLDALNGERYLRMRGPSKEHRTDLPLVSVALVMDKGGFPINFQVFSGNASEKTHMRESIEKLKKKHNVDNSIVVADRGLNSVANLQMLAELDMGFVVAQSVKQIKDPKIQEKLFKLDEYQTIPVGNQDVFKYRTVEWVKTGVGGKSVKCSLILTYSERRMRRDKAILDAWVALINRKAERGDKIKPRAGWAALATTDGSAEAKITGIDEAEYQRQLKFCGLAAIVYEDSPKLQAALNPPIKEEVSPQDQDEEKPEPSIVRQLSGEGVVRDYRALGRIEECFRIMKSNLGLRPMFVSNSHHINGHITICVLALFLIRLLQSKLKEQQVSMSVNEICAAFSKHVVGAVSDGHGDYNFLQLSWGSNVRKGRERMPEETLISMIKSQKITVRDHMADIMAVCGLRMPPAVCSRTELATCLKTRFRTIEDAIPPIRIALEEA